MSTGSRSRVVVAVGYVVVAGAFFLLGRLTSQEGAPPPPEPTPEAKAPSAMPAPEQKPRYRVDDLKVGVAAAPTASIPPGTKPAADPSPADGPADALVVVNEVSDFQCPVCKRAWEPLKNLAKDYKGKVRLVFKHNPLEMHRNAMNAAVAAMAAARQGKFFAYADILFQNQQALTEDDLFRYARQAGLDMQRFDKDYKDMSLRARARAEGDAASALGAQGTPSFFINGRKEVGWASYEAIRQQVEQEIAAVEELVRGGKTVKEARIARVRANLPDGADQYLSGPLGAEFR